MSIARSVGNIVTPSRTAVPYLTPRQIEGVEGRALAGICEGRVVIVTGAGRGLGRSHALEFARQGAKVVVNDLGAELDGTGSSTGPAGEVVDAIRAAGGEAVANGDDVADWDGAARLVHTAIDAFGGLDVLVNNAGFLRDRMVVSTSEEEWDAVIRVHLKGHFCPTRHATGYWREQSKVGAPVDARIVNTSSGAGLMGSVGQGTYSAAKAGIAALTLVEAAELGRYGVTANAIAPAARTRMTEGTFSETMAKPDEGFDAMAPENVSPLVVWLGSPESREVTGRVFEAEGGIIGVADGWQHGPRVDKGARWDPNDVGTAVREVLAKAPPPAPVYGAPDR
jgi:NAD(P)-dependent dehydrogenase (short-subunit alcohol dehydrogenase family)